MKYCAFYAQNALGVYTEDECGEKKLEEASKFLKKAKFKSFSDLEDAIEYAIEGYNDRHNEPDEIFTGRSLGLNWTYYRKTLIREYYERKTNAD